MRRKSKRKLLTLDVIRAASKGDYEAMDIVLRHYEGYILKLSIRHSMMKKDSFIIDKSGSGTATKNKDNKIL